MKNNSMAKGFALGAGVTTALVGAYLLYGSKDALKNRKKVQSWMLSAKGEILEKMENLSEINEEVYQKIVAEVSDKYQTLKNIDKKDIEEFVDDLKDYWKNIVKDTKASSKKIHKKLKSK